MVERVEGKWLGAYLAEQLQWSRAERLQPLFVSANEEEKFFDWLDRSKPDVILIAEPHIEDWLASRKARNNPKTTWLRMLEHMRKDVFAIDTQPEKMGAAAVELVVGQIHRNERGSPEIPHTLLLDGVWAA